jgi:Tol biopolymer transport system component
MAIQPGTHLGPYEILSAIGAGGMGEVYRARDPKLGRDVAIKVLPEAFARDTDRMARFQREAKVLASLDHPNIASIYGLEDSGGTRALVMQLVEGPTLADRIKQGPIAVDEAVRIAKQIADALEYAHERGIIHRDLKPANVRVTNDDAVKVLDFGLAKALEGDPSSLDISTSPTISRMATMQGVLLGTAAYMSPEQAKAKPVDRRADIWAFGCVFYEMLTAKVAFHGDTVTDTLAAVVRAEPDWSQLPATTPMRVRVLLQRCLQKDAKQRLRDIGDARISLNEVLSGVPEPASGPAASLPAWRRMIPWGVACAFAVAPAVFAWAPWRGAATSTSTEPVLFQVQLPEKMTLGPTGVFALSPDGRQLAFAAIGADGVQRLWVRSLGALEARPLPGSETTLFLPFFWSPDSRFIAFDAGGKLKKIPVAGGPAETICDLSALAIGGSWSRNGTIIFSTSGSVMRVSAAGGVAAPLIIAEPSRESASLPSFLPDGRHFIYLRSSSQPEKSGIYVGSLDAKPDEQNSNLLVAAQNMPAYVPSADSDAGYLLFMREGTLMAQPFDARRLELSGEPFALADKVATFLNLSAFSASVNGVLAYQTGTGGRTFQLRWFDRQGKVLGVAGEPSTIFSSVDLSPDGTRAAIARVEAPSQTLWLLDLARGTNTRFTFGSSSALAPVWSPDASSIIFALSRGGNFDLYQKPANGTKDEELLLKSSEDKYPTSWSRDGRFLLYTAAGPKANYGLWVLPIGGDKKPFPFLRTEFNERSGQFSPDGRWVAYSSDESGRDEIYVRAFSPVSGEAGNGAGGKWLISNNGGILPRWRADGKELYYRTLYGTLMAVEVKTGSAFEEGAPKVLMQAPLITVLKISPTWDVSSDGKRFFLPAPTAQSIQASFTVVLNWQAALKK